MIRHIAELWLTLAVVFLFGCLIGTLVQRAVGQSRAAKLQMRFAVLLLRLGRAILWQLFPWRGQAPAIPAPVAVPTPAYGTAVAELGALVPHELPPEEPEVEEINEVEAEGLAKKPSAAAERRLRAALARAEASGGHRPPVLPGPRNGQGDPLARIDGLSRKEANRLAELGVFHFGQVAAWTPAELTWIAAYLGRSEPADTLPWIASATALASGAVPVKSKRPPLKTNEADEPNIGPAPVENAREKEPAASGDASAPVEEAGSGEDAAVTQEEIFEPKPGELPVDATLSNASPVPAEVTAIAVEAAAADAGGEVSESEASSERGPSKPLVEPSHEIRDRRDEPAA